jgi:hypothetical protein
LFLNYFFSILLFAGVAAAATHAVAATVGDAKIQQWLSRHARQVQGVEAPAARHRVVGDLDGDGRNDVAVLYTLKARTARGGESRYLAAFRRQREGAGAGRPEHAPGNRRDVLRYHGHVLVSGPGAGEANRVTILERRLVVEMLTFAPGDAACCPTRAATRHYRLDARGLVLVRPEGIKRAPGR